MADEGVAHDDALIQKYGDKIKALDIQAFTIAVVCNIYGKNLIVVKGVSEKIDAKENADELKAMKNTLETLKFISAYLMKQ